MSERSILDAAARLRATGEDYVIATVVCVNGSSYRRPGARMLVSRDRWIAGSVSGGCLEGDVVRKGWWRTQTGDPVVVTYDARPRDRDDDDELEAGFGLGCDGVVDVLIERARRPGHLDSLAFVETCVTRQELGALATVFRSADPASAAVGERVSVRITDEGAAVHVDAIEARLATKIVADARRVAESRRSDLVRYAGVEVLIEAICPPPRLFVFGGGHDAVPVAQLARALGWEVYVCAAAARIEVRERFAGIADELLFGPFDEVAPCIDESARAAAIVMTHHAEHDRDAMAMLLASRARYIGVLGPRRRTERLLGELGLAAGTAPIDARLHAPVGLALGAETPQEIALSIIAEIQAELGEADGKQLRAQAGPIHAEPSSPAQGLRVADAAG